ncbi:cytochrome P450 2A5-like [Rhinophrynus dorsalis]
MFTMDFEVLGTFLLVVIATFFIYATWGTLHKKGNLPPGPTPLPLIGNLLQLNREELTTSLIKLWKQYGPVYTLYFGQKTSVMLCGYEAVKEALIDQAEDFSARGDVQMLNEVTQGYGIAFSNGERWWQLRHFTLKNLRNYGMGKKSIEWKIQEEAQYLVEELKKTRESDIDPSKRLLNAVSNILCSVIFGNRYEYTDERFLKLVGTVSEIHGLLSSTWGQLGNMFPTLMKYVPGPHQKLISISEELVSMIYDRVKTNQETLDPTAPRDFIDSFLIQLQEEKQKPNSEFHMKNILMTFYSLFLAGMEASTTTLRFSLLMMVKYTDIQAKIHREIDQVIGRERAPNMGDRSEMPYTEAVINEIQRFCDVIPLNITHAVTKDTEFRGFTIPKDTDVFPLLCTVHRDPKYFSTPNKFNPNHFLDEQGKFKKNDAMVAFSLGKRVCLGEGLARMEIFLFLTTILQNFTLTTQMCLSESDIAPRTHAFVNYPIPHKVSFVSR